MSTATVPQKLERRMDPTSNAWCMDFFRDGVKVGHLFMTGGGNYLYEVYRESDLHNTRVNSEDEAEAWLIANAT